MKPVYHRPNKFLHTEHAGVLMAASGEWLIRQNKLWRPTHKELRRMLLDIKQKHGISVTALAAFLGVPRVTARAWLRGYRSPAGAASRLVWVLWSAMFNPTVLDSADAWYRFERPGMKPTLVKLLEEREQAQSTP